jgi:excisionase family DNA binding protein
MKETRPKPVRGELETFKEAAKRLRMGYSTFYEVIKKGYIEPFDMPVGHLLVDSADVDDYLFFSKYNQNPGKRISNIEKEEIIARFEEQIMHTRAFIEKIINERNGRKEDA